VRTERREAVDWRNRYGSGDGGGGKKIYFNQSACIVRAQIGVLIWTNATAAG